MARPATYSKSELVAKLADVFRRSGYGGASMADLSAATGLSKASLYHHFSGGKAEMAAMVMAEEGKRLQKLVLAPLMKKESPVGALQNSLDGVALFYGGDVPQCLMNSILLGSGEAIFRKEISTALSVWIRAMADVYAAAGSADDEAQAWASYALERIQGALIICRVVANRSPLEQCLAELHGDVTAIDAS